MEIIGLGGLVLGFVAAFCWARYVQAIAANSAIAGAIWDGAILLPAMLLKQLWATLDDNFLIFLLYVLGSMIGTYVVLRKRG